MRIFRRGSPLKGVTLAELMVTLVIIGILATMAFPMFTRAMEATKAKEAVAALQQIRTGERVYRMEENAYWGPSAGGGIAEIKQINANLRTFLDYSSNRNWDYRIASATGDTFVAAAIRTEGSYRNRAIAIDQNGNLGGRFWPLPLPGQ